MKKMVRFIDSNLCLAESDDYNDSIDSNDSNDSNSK